MDPNYSKQTMISHKYRCIFIHIPKCAGTSIEAALGHLDNHTGRGGQDHRTLRMIEPVTFSTFKNRENLVELFRRIKLQYIRKPLNQRNRLTVTRRQYESYFKFTFVRNPWARAFSWYRNVMRDEWHRRNLGLPEDIPLNLFLKKYAGLMELRPQLDWIRNFRGDVSLDYIGRFENLHTDFKKICKRLGLDEISLPHKVKGQGEDYRKFYDTESKDLIHQVYQDEIKMFGYSFEE